MYGKTETKRIVHLNGTDREKSDFENLNELTSMRCCLCGNVPVSGLTYMTTFVLPNFNFKLMYYWRKPCMEIYNYRKVISEF